MPGGGGGGGQRGHAGGTQVGPGATVVCCMDRETGRGTEYRRQGSSAQPSHKVASGLPEGPVGQGLVGQRKAQARLPLPCQPRCSLSPPAPPCPQGVRLPAGGAAAAAGRAPQGGHGVGGAGAGLRVGDAGGVERPGGRSAR